MTAHPESGGHDGAQPGSAGSSRRPRVMVFDVDETLSDMSPMSQRFTEVGARVPERSLSRAVTCGFMLVWSVWRV